MTRASPRWQGEALRRLALAGALLLIGLSLGPTSQGAPLPGSTAPPRLLHADSSPVANFSSAMQRLVTLVGVAGGALLALVWARVALSWFSNDVGKKISAKDRARDALVGTLLFTAALTGLIWGLARWVLTGS